MTTLSDMVMQCGGGGCCVLEQCFQYPRRAREPRDCGCQFALLHRADIAWPSVLANNLYFYYYCYYYYYYYYYYYATTTTLLLLLLLRLLLLLVNYDYFSSSSFSSSPTSITTTTTTYASYLLLRNTFLLLFYFLYFSSSPCSPLLSILNSCFFHWSLAHFYSLLYLVFYPIFSRCAFVLLLYVLHASIPLYSPCGSLLSVLPTESTFRYSSGRL